MKNILDREARDFGANPPSVVTSSLSPGTLSSQIEGGGEVGGSLQSLAAGSGQSGEVGRGTVDWCSSHPGACPPEHILLNSLSSMKF